MNFKRLRSVGFALLCGLPLFAASCGAGTDIREMRCEYTESPIAIDVQAPRFTWIYTHGEDFVQAGYRVCVATTAEGVATPDVWDSGEVASPLAFAQMPADELLKSRTPYFWRVEAWDANGSKRIVSPVAQFETAIMNTSEWQAVWISDSYDRDYVPAPMLRRAFEVKPGVASARLYISAAAYARTRLNGEPVSENLLDPGYTAYDKRNLYAAHDVTKHLTEGENVLSAVLGNGFYNAIKPVATWNFENARWRNRARMICELHITYNDGSEQVVKSDDAWRTTADGPYLQNNIYSGDVYDARKELKGWEKPGFDDSAWAQATVVEAPSKLLKAQIMPAIQATREFEPIAMQSFGDTVYVFDFGTNITGLCRLEVEGERDTEVEFIHGEFLQPDGRIEMRNLNIYYKHMEGYPFQGDKYILKGEGREQWTPDFTYHGFRYVELTTSKPMKLDKKSLTARFMHTAVKSVGEFSSSSELFNRVWEMTRQTYLDNLTSIPTDCPQREKNGWTADGYLALELALLNYDGLTFYEKWLDDFVDNINEQGRISGIIPTADWGYDDWIGPVWDASAFIIPATLYNYYGDLTPIEKMWPVCERYLDYLQTREEPDGGVTYGIGDWVYIHTQTPTDYTSTCFYYYDNVLMTEFARLLGRDGERYARKAAQLRELINSKYYDAEKGLYANGSQTAQGVALYMNLVPEGDAQRVADNLNQKIVENNYFLDFGTVGSKTVLRMLTRYGHAQTAFLMASQETCPSWGWWVKQGFTTLAETWSLSPEWRDASVNHVFLGDVSAWYVNDIVGINCDPQAPGFSHIVFAPHVVEGLDWAKASYNSVKGMIRAEWKREGDKVMMTVTVPDNTTATLRIDGKDREQIKAGTHTFEL